MWKVALTFVLAAVIGCGAAILVTDRATILPSHANAAANLTEDSKPSLHARRGMTSSFPTIPLSLMKAEPCASTTT